MTSTAAWEYAGAGLWRVPCPGNWIYANGEGARASALAFVPAPAAPPPLPARTPAAPQSFAAAADALGFAGRPAA